MRASVGGGMRNEGMRDGVPGLGIMKKLFRSWQVIGGADHLLVHTDGSAVPDVRLVLRTDDGALIQMEYKGVLRAPREVMMRFGKPETLKPEEYYFRVTVYFETAAEKYNWLNSAVCVGYGIPMKLPNGNNGVRYDVYKLL